MKTSVGRYLPPRYLPGGKYREIPSCPILPKCPIPGNTGKYWSIEWSSGNFLCTGYFKCIMKQLNSQVFICCSLFSSISFNRSLIYLTLWSTSHGEVVKWTGQFIFKVVNWTGRSNFNVGNTGQLNGQVGFFCVLVILLNALWSNWTLRFSHVVLYSVQ